MALNGLWSLNYSEVHVKTDGVHFCFGGSGVVCGISLTALMLGITLAFYNIVNDFQNYVFSYDIYMNTGHFLFLSLLEHYHFFSYHIVVFQKYFQVLFLGS